MIIIDDFVMILFFYLLTFLLTSIEFQTPLSQTALRLEEMGMKNIAQANPDIVIDLMYTHPDNFTGKILYDDLTEGYLHPHALEGLLKAQQLLKLSHPTYTLIIYDAARPMHVQQKMWNVVKGTPQRIYVSNPANGGGLHNYGLAVDVSILDENRQPLAMGTPVDHLGKEAHITHENQLLQNGKITADELENRLLLRNIMREAGFRPLHSEWWHFNWCSREVARQKYEVIP